MGCCSSVEIIVPPHGVVSANGRLDDRGRRVTVPLPLHRPRADFLRQPGVGVPLRAQGREIELPDIPHPSRYRRRRDNPEPREIKRRGRGGRRPRSGAQFGREGRRGGIDADDEEEGDEDGYDLDDFDDWYDARGGPGDYSGSDSDSYDARELRRLRRRYRHLSRRHRRPRRPGGRQRRSSMLPLAAKGSITSDSSDAEVEPHGHQQDGSHAHHSASPQHSHSNASGSHQDHNGGNNDNPDNNDNSDSVSLSDGGGGDDAVSGSTGIESDVTADDGSVVIIAEDVAALLIGSPTKLLDDGLNRGRDLDRLENDAIHQTVMVIEEGIKKAEQQNARVRSRGDRANFPRTGDGGRSNDPTAPGTGNDANASNAGGSPAASQHGDDADNHGSDYSINHNSSFAGDPDDDEEIPSITLARANDLLARLYSLRRFERCSVQRSLAAFLRALDYLSTREDDVMLWASVHMGLAHALLARDHSNIAQVPKNATSAEREAAVAELDVGLSHANESRSISRAIRHARSALEIYDGTSTPQLFSEAWCMLGEAYTRRADLPLEPNANDPLSNPTGSTQVVTDDSATRTALAHVKDNLFEARKCYETALATVTKADDPDDWARIHSWLGHLAMRYRAHQVEERHIAAARTETEELTELLDQEQTPEPGATAPSSVLRTSPNDPPASSIQFGAKEAIENLSRATEVFDRDSKPVHYGNLQHAIGVAHLALADDRLYFSPRTRGTGGAGPSAVAALDDGSLQEFKALQQAIRRDIYLAVKAFSRALAVKTWSVNAGFDYSNTAQCRAEAQRKLSAHLAKYPNLAADNEEDVDGEDDGNPAHVGDAAPS